MAFQHLATLMNPLLLFNASAEKELRRIPQPLLGKIVQKIESLVTHSRPYGVQMLCGDDRYYRLRQADYRIVYEVSDQEKRITIIKIGHHREVYE